AERLYRITGAGIYRDSVLTGIPVPIKEPTLNSQVLGCDSVLTAVYGGRIYWFWNDTNRAGYPLGNFHGTGATSEFPARRGRDAGGALAYSRDAGGFVKEMAQLPGGGPPWLVSITALPDTAGRERLYASYLKVKPPMRVYARGLAVFDDEKQRFVHAADVDMA